MSSISSTSSASSLSTIRGYGGLASGLDRDTLIEQMTSGTKSKIAAEKQKQTKIEWEQTAIRDITTKIYNFSNTYTSYASSSNLSSSKLFSRNQITALGKNSDKVSVSGTAASSNNLSIAGIKQLAKNASMVASKVSNQKLETGEIKLGANRKLSEESEVSTILGDALYIKYGTKSYTVKMEEKEGYDYTELEDVARAINDQLATVSVGTSSNPKTLGDVMSAKIEGGRVTFTVDDSKTSGNTVALGGGTGNILQDLGFLSSNEKFSDLDDEDKVITSKGLTGKYIADLTETQTLAQRLSEKKIAFSYNGETQWITLNKYNSTNNIDQVEKDIQNKLDKAYGKGRIAVSFSPEDANAKSGHFSFKTIKPDGTDDASSTLSITSGEGIVGAGGLFGVKEGESNRLNLSGTLADAGFENSAALKEAANPDGTYNLWINGTKVEGITKDSTIQDIINKINDTDGIGVKVEYQSLSDRFILTATDSGASGKIAYNNNGFADKNGADKKNIASLLFGKHGSDTETHKETLGQDAVVSIKYPGSGDPVEITRGSNSFSLDGLNITLKEEFGYKEVKKALVDEEGNPMVDEEGNPRIITVKEPDMEAEEITFDATVDVDKTTETVKGMIDAFNEILTQVNKEVGTKPDRDYAPLTDEQKEELSEDEIEKWEEKAKAGILFCDADLRMMVDSMRTVISSMDRATLSNMGITTSTNYADNGKLVFDEEKFKAALQEDPEAVMQVFNRKPSEDEDGNTIPGGLLTRIGDVMNRYGSMTGATKGILVERAGSIYSVTSVLNNSLQKEWDQIDDYIDRLYDKLETETDRYISQFTQLESLISQMNSQSSYLSSMFA